MSAPIIAFGAISAMGEGWDAVSAGEPGERARGYIVRDEELVKAGLARPHVARAKLAAGAGDRATLLLRRAAELCARDLDAALPAWRRLRVGLALGTSSGGMRSAEALFDAQLAGVGGAELHVVAREATYFAPMSELVRTLGLELEPATLVMGACAASTIAVGLGLRWLADDACDLVLAGGFDAVSVFVASGFEVLRATTEALPPRPFRTGRDGMALGEGAALIAMASPQVAAKAILYVTGFSASSDAHHLTAPDPTGAGLAAAATGALREAGLLYPDLVSPHGTATPYSDAAEARALAQALGDAAGEVTVHPFKAQIGHTLGASGALELLAAADALRRGVYPAAAGEGPIDPDASTRLREVASAGTLRSALKLSAAFGGANAALVVSREPGRPARGPRRVYVGRPVYVGALPGTEALATMLRLPVDRVVRADALARWSLAAAAMLLARDGAPRGAGVIVGTTFATIETNMAFHARIRERGARMAEPRRFPYTSPNAASGEVSVAFGLRGPSFAVGSGAHAGLEAVVVAAQLVGAGDASAMLVVASDDIGPSALAIAEGLGIEARSGAVALLVSAEPAGALAEVVGARCGAGSGGQARAVRCGHLALLALTGDAVPREIRASSPHFEDAGRHACGWASLALDPTPN